MAFKSLLKWPFDGNGESANWQLVCFLAAFGGATAVGEYWTIKHYLWVTTTTVAYPYSSTHLNLSLLVAVALLVCFTACTAISSVLVRWQERNKSRWRYGLVWLLQAFLFAGCGLLGTYSADHERLFLAVGAILFSFLLALQNSMITSSLSKQLRTDRLGGIVTGLGIELGNLIYETATKKIAGKRSRDGDRTRLMLLTAVVGFFLGGVLFANIGFNQLGFPCYLLLAAFLFLISTAVLIASRLSL